jgi:hypothetical protein
MCRTTTPPRPAAQNAIHNLPPNTTAGAVIGLQAYLAKYTTQFANDLIPTTPPTLPSDVDPVAYKRVAFSILPLRANAVSPYYAGIFDEDTDFSASLVKAAAMFVAGQFLAEAKTATPAAGADIFKNFNNAIKAEINTNADDRVKNATYPPGGIPVGLLPKTSSILTGLGPTADFQPTFKNKQSRMIVESDDPSAGYCINNLGYGYISSALNNEGFFDKTLTPGPDKAGATGRGIWLTANYDGNFLAGGRIPCVNDHPDAELASARQMCRLFAMIRLKQLPEHDLDTNTIMQNLLNEPKMGANATGPWLGRNPGVALKFTILQDKIGFAGLGTIQRPNVYSEGLIIKWDASSQIDTFNSKIDPGNAHPDSRLTGEFAVCWQNLLAELLAGGTAADPMFEPIVNVLNNAISDFLDQKAL